MKYDDLMILASFDFILQTILAVFLIFFVYKIHINYVREIKHAKKLREESQADE